MLRILGLILLTASWCFSLPLQAQESIPYLLTASAKGDVKTVQAMLASGVNPNTVDSEGITALMYAARKDRAEVVKVLLDKGADINAKDKGGWTALSSPPRRTMCRPCKCYSTMGPTPRCATNLAGAHSAWQRPRVTTKPSTC
jgi:hypothetical protein